MLQIYKIKSKNALETLKKYPAVPFLYRVTKHELEISLEIRATI